MYKKLIFLMCFVLVLGSASSISMASTWSGPTLPSHDANWTTASNWDTAAVPGLGDNVTIGNAAGEVNQPIVTTAAPIFGSSSDGPAIGFSGVAVSNVSLKIMPGGSLTTDGTASSDTLRSIGAISMANAKSTLTQKGGIVRLRQGAAWDNSTGFNGYTGPWGIWGGYRPGNEADIFLDGGTFKIQNGGFEVARGDDISGSGTGEGYCYLRGGIVDVNGYVTVRSIRPCVMSGECDTYIIDDNYPGRTTWTTPGKGGVDINSTLSQIIVTGEMGVNKRGASDTEAVTQTIIQQFQAYDANHFVTGWGRPAHCGTSYWPKRSDPKAELQMDYDMRNPGRTTISAYLAKPYEANKPGEVGKPPSSTPYSARMYGDKVGLHPILTWSPAVSMPAYTTGQNGKGHHVFFNTDKASVYPATGFGTKYALGTRYGHYRATTNSFDPAHCIIDNAGTYGSVPYCDTGGNLALNTMYYWSVMEVNSTDNNGYPSGPNITAGRGQIWQFRTLSGSAKNPSPADKSTKEFAPIATGGSISLTLSWTAGFFASTTMGHDVYMGTVQADVNSATTATAGIYKGRQTAPSYQATPLSLNTTYYWRVDEINNANTNSPWKGPVWQFSIPNYVLIDNFSTYGSTSDLLNKWKANNFYTVFGYYLPAYRCTTAYSCGSTITVSGGTMQYNYDNTVTGAEYSEAVYTFPGVDFTTGSQGTAALSMTYNGAATNGTDPMYDKMYLILRDANSDTTGNGVLVNHWDPNAARVTTTTAYWSQWNIDIDDFTGINLTAVKRLYLGFGVPGHLTGTKGGKGVVYFDNFRIYQPRCVGLYAYRQLPGDIYLSTSGAPVSDCTVDLKDLRMLVAQPSFGNISPLGTKPLNNSGAGNWLKTDHWTDAIPANDPCDSNMIAYWKCSDGSGQIVHDYSENGHNGRFGRLATADSNDPNWVTDTDANHPHKTVLDFNDKEFVTCGSGPWSNLENSDLTLSAWIKLKARTSTGWECFVAKGERAWKLQMLISNAVIHFAYPRGGDGGTRNLNLNKWYHVAGVWHAEPTQRRAYAYVNGLLDGGTITASYTQPQASDCNVILGAKDDEKIYKEPNGIENRNKPLAHCPCDDVNGPQIHFLKGRLDDVRIYNRALTEGELMRLARTTNPLFVTGYRRHYNSPSSSDAYGSSATNALWGRYPSDLQWPFPPDGKVDFKDFATMAKDWLESANWPYRP